MKGLRMAHLEQVPTRTPTQRLEPKLESEIRSEALATENRHLKYLVLGLRISLYAVLAALVIFVAIVAVMAAGR
jgi:hypothetical protein